MQTKSEREFWAEPWMLSTLASTHSSPRQDCAPITAVIAQSPPSPVRVWVCGCVSVRARALAEGSFSVTGAIAGIVAEQVSTQLSWVRPAAIHVGRWLQVIQIILIHYYKDTHSPILHLHSWLSNIPLVTDIKIHPFIHLVQGQIAGAAA